MSLRSLSNTHRADLRELTGLASSDLAAMWHQFETVDDTRDGLLDVLPQLVAIYGSAAATLGADWYEEMRDEAGVNGSFAAIAAELPDRGRTDALARWAVSPMFADSVDFSDGGFGAVKAVVLAKVVGGLTTIIANGDRDSVRISSGRDRRSEGWVRSTSGGCPFCESLVDGEVHGGDAVAFPAHDGCHCLAVPVFR